MNRESNFDTAFSKALPRELQAEILFRYAQSVREEEFYEGYHVHYEGKYGRQGRPGYLLDIMLVCSTWFHITRTDPRFWTAINFAWCPWKIAKYLTLSKSAGLRLAIPTYNDSPLIREKSKLLMKYINRARGIEFLPLTDFGSISRGWGAPEPEKPAVILHLLQDVIDNNLAPSLTHLMVRDADRIYTLPPSVSFLSLRTLELGGCLLQGAWVETLPASLEEIRVFYSNIHVGEDDIPTLLRRCSRLEVLAFSDNTLLIREYKETVAQTDDSVISVENLRKLKPWPLSRNGLERIFNTCTFHHMPKFNITLQPSTGSISPLLPKPIANCMARSTSLELRVTYDVIKAIFSDSQSMSPNERHTLEVNLRGEIKSKETLQSRWYANLDEIIHLFKNVTDLKVHQHPRRRTPRGTSRCIWPSLLTAFRGITTLEVGGVIDDELFEILEVPGQLSEVPFPCLAYLRLGYEEDYYDTVIYPLTDDERGPGFPDTGTSFGSLEQKRAKEDKHRHDLFTAFLSNRMTASGKLARLVVDSRCIWMEKHPSSEELNPETVKRFVDVFEVREPAFEPVADDF
ncbi:hypothetical protein SISSUDRAFT_1067849 [Sistotremastrum suecicum HHB10207 ss-3]|uniref:F-box domain-containing protein n=1 Tax=Sistotremastrum suecicum HHB10207 ss-3 TaxID=1314776 RepID=A0A165WMD9_9AGAM|nr:hypothetical protein SISSUDRAFT_1067849 [Sistotremastrum suecicum HHB10207 ss-3]